MFTSDAIKEEYKTKLSKLSSADQYVECDKLLFKIGRDYTNTDLLDELVEILESIDILPRAVIIKRLNHEQTGYLKNNQKFQHMLEHDFKKDKKQKTNKK